MDDWFRNCPPVTRVYLTLSVITTVACSMDLVTPFNLYFNSSLIFKKYELWRLLTNFFFFGYFGLDFIFHMFFFTRFCRSLEEGFYRNRVADFLFMLMFGASIMLIIAMSTQVMFLGPSLNYMVVYVWSRRNPQARMNFLYLFQFSAPWLSWVLIGFALVLGHSITFDIIGIVVGHIYFVLEDVYPYHGGHRLLATPHFLKKLCGEDADNPYQAYQYAVPEDAAAAPAMF
eukprot:gnl/Spiro4/11286_TR5949_c0_g1_i1.p1 gnl/Spiro4/11286_TR5949_c0_g1~~gnl/Spiro4/11286_TR5949_c0_g1_i1.p1  ORF type:complete len:249 (-),score=56.65 gnl/Spiro4/11286_TR5949_c0_g1_i1:104-793(-)